MPWRTKKLAEYLSSTSHYFRSNWQRDVQKYGDMVNEIDCEINEEYKASLFKETHLEAWKTEHRLY